MEEVKETFRVLDRLYRLTRIYKNYRKCTCEFHAPVKQMKYHALYRCTRCGGKHDWMDILNRRAH